MTERIASPLLGSTWVSVSREVLADCLLRCEQNAYESDGDITTSRRFRRLAEEVRAGTLDHIDAATWRGGRGEAGE